MKPRSFHNNMRGNVLFIILIAIALLAALTWSMTRTSRTMSTVSAEDAEIATQNILSYTNSVMEATERVMASNGCRDDQVSFENPVVAGYTNPNAPADQRCHIFAQDGGGLTWEEPSADWLDGSHAADALYGQFVVPGGGSCIYDVGQGDGATGCPAAYSDIFIAIPFLKEEICTSINKKLGVNLPLGTAPIDGTNAWLPANAKYTGSFSATAVISLGAYNGRQAVCFQSTTTPAGGYHFYQVLIAR